MGFLELRWFKLRGTCDNCYAADVETWTLLKGTDATPATSMPALCAPCRNTWIDLTMRGMPGHGSA